MPRLRSATLHSTRSSSLSPRNYLTNIDHNGINKKNEIKKIFYFFYVPPTLNAPSIHPSRRTHKKVSFESKSRGGEKLKSFVTINLASTITVCSLARALESPFQSLIKPTVSRSANIIREKEEDSVAVVVETTTRRILWHDWSMGCSD